MTDGSWAADGLTLDVNGVTGWVQNTSRDGGFFCNFACALNGGWFDMSVGAGGQADGQVEQFNYPSTGDISGAVGLPYDIWTDGFNEYLTVYRSLENPAGIDDHFFR